MVGLVIQNYYNYQMDLAESRTRIQNRRNQIKAVLEKTNDPEVIDRNLRPLMSDFSVCGHKAESSIENMKQLYADNEKLGPVLKVLTFILGDAVGRTERKHQKLQDELAALGLQDEYRKNLEETKRRKAVKAEPMVETSAIRVSVEKPAVEEVSDLEEAHFDARLEKGIARFLQFAHQLGKKDFRTILNEVVVEDHQLQRLNEFMDRLHPSELIDSNDDEKLNRAFINSIIAQPILGNDPGFYLKHQDFGLRVVSKKSWGEGGVIFKGEISHALKQLPLKNQESFERKLFNKLDGVSSESEKLRLMENCMRNADEIVIRNEDTPETLINRLLTDEDDFQRMNAA